MRSEFEQHLPANGHSITAAFMDPWFQNLTLVHDSLKTKRMTSTGFLRGQDEKHVKSENDGDACLHKSLAQCRELVRAVHYQGQVETIHASIFIL